MAWVLGRYMVVYGGMNDFNKLLGELIVYDLDKDEWIEKLRVKKGKLPSISHAQAATVFYEQRQRQYIKNLYNIPGVEWNKIDHFILEEGFYLFGGFLEGAYATNDLWILQPELENIKWKKVETQGVPPEPRYQHAMTYYKKENSLLISGGRNDKVQAIYSDLYFLTLDTLSWVKIDCIRGQGSLALADHQLLLFNETDFLIMGGVDPDYKLSNKITMLTFQESRIWAYAHNKRPSIKKLASNGGGESSPKEAKGQPAPPQFRLAATNSFL